MSTLSTLRPLPHIPTSRPRGMLLLGLLPFGLVSLVAGLLGVRLHRLQQSLDGLELRTTSMASDLKGVVEQADAIRAEMKDLRSATAEHSSEDVLYLKIMVLHPNLDSDLARTIAANVLRYATLYGKDPNLVLAIINVESGFDPKAVSSVGAVGLMQVMPHWKRILGIHEELRDPETSIRYGLQILGFYEQMYHDPEMVLTAYNRGPGPVDEALMHGRSPRNDYAPRVLQAYERLRRLRLEPGS
jgi:soluble lytic murein transglycosylase-like protein